jgi:hypothetical protein
VVEGRRGDQKINVALDDAASSESGLEELQRADGAPNQTAKLLREKERRVKNLYEALTKMGWSPGRQLSRARKWRLIPTNRAWRCLSSASSWVSG